MHQISVLIIFFAFQYTFSLNQCYFSTNSSVVHGQILKENSFYGENSATFISCMKKCIRFSICLSINFLDDGKCLLNYNTSDAEPSSFVLREESRYIRKSDFSVELSDACQHHSCKMDEMCHTSRISGPVCVKYGVCARNPKQAANAVYKISYSHGVKTSEYSCIHPSVHADGDTLASCRIPEGWTEPQIRCTTELPAACGDPPTTSMPSTKTVASPTIVRYTCLTRTDTKPVAHCPVSTCTGVRSWTKPTLSCSGYDCRSGNTYSGKSNCSENGLPCLVWSEAGDPRYSHLGNNNHCSDYGAIIPWCIVEPRPFWQNCHVPPCGTG